MCALRSLQPRSLPACAQHSGGCVTGRATEPLISFLLSEGSENSALLFKSISAAYTRLSTPEEEQDDQEAFNDEMAQGMFARPFAPSHPLI